MKNDTVDILLATFNGFAFIASQLDSILSQSHKEIHLIIRDDLSTDSTRKILETYANRFPEMITLLPSEAQLGVKGNFSHLMERAKADYIMFADQDDVWEEEKVGRTLERMKGLEQKYCSDIPLLVHTDLKVVDRDLNVLSPSLWSYSGIEPSKGQTLNRLLMQNVVTGCTMMINRSLLTLGSPVPESAIMHDWWLALVAAAFGKVETLPEATMLYRQHGKNTLGARKFLSLSNFRYGMGRINKQETAKQLHATELLKRYFYLLSSHQKQLLKAFNKLPRASFPQKAFLILRYRFFKMGFIRNAVNILVKTQ
ncbi:MAG TPA: glycosyltransferase family 2 protein [Parachlamydiaceae bacterium]|nr:glycosyltransferase family 2 protein [Parachlamydiaceae bacterium]